ncbi:hypothetical protein B4123_2242 [Bacillus paralicheniformis]|nr:hypothetical protein B4123_2242 [Bacillus paralicheniformis]
MFKQTDLLAQRGLSDIQFFGGTGKMKLPAQCHEIFQLL